VGGIEQHMDLFDQMLDNLRKSACQGVEMPLDELIESFLPEMDDCHCTMLAVSLGIAIQRLVLTARDIVH
jgi:hypothetical protein